MNKFKLLVLFGLIIPSIEAFEVDSSDDYEVISYQDTFTEQQLQAINFIETMINKLELLLNRCPELICWSGKTLEFIDKDGKKVVHILSDNKNVSNVECLGATPDLKIGDIYIALKQIYEKIQELKVGQSDLHNLNLINKILRYSCRLANLIREFNKFEIRELAKDCTDIESTKLAVSKFESKKNCSRRNARRGVLIKLEQTKKYIIKKLKKLANNGNLKAIKLIYNTPSIQLTEKQHKKFSEILEDQGIMYDSEK